MAGVLQIQTDLACSFAEHPTVRRTVNLEDNGVTLLVLKMNSLGPRFWSQQTEQLDALDDHDKKEPHVFSHASLRILRGVATRPALSLASLPVSSAALSPPLDDGDSSTTASGATATAAKNLQARPPSWLPYLPSTTWMPTMPSLPLLPSLRTGVGSSGGTDPQQESKAQLMPPSSDAAAASYLAQKEQGWEGQAQPTSPHHAGSWVTGTLAQQTRKQLAGLSASAVGATIAGVVVGGLIGGPLGLAVGAKAGAAAVAAGALAGAAVQHYTHPAPGATAGAATPEDKLSLQPCNLTKL